LQFFHVVSVGSRANVFPSDNHVGRLRSRQSNVLFGKAAERPENDKNKNKKRVKYSEHTMMSRPKSAFRES
jgi:hypothetical protein